MKQFVCNVLRLVVAVHGVLLVHSGDLHSDCVHHQSLYLHYDQGLPTAESQCSGSCTMFEAFMTITVANVQQVNFICLGSNEEELNRLEKRDLSPAEQTVTTGFDSDADHMGQCHTVDVELVAHPGMSANYSIERFEACTENKNCEFIFCEGIKFCEVDCSDGFLTTLDFNNRNSWLINGAGDGGESALKGSETSFIHDGKVTLKLSLGFTNSHKVNYYEARPAIININYKLSCEKSGFVYVGFYAYSAGIINEYFEIMEYPQAGVEQSVDLPCRNDWNTAFVFCSENGNLDPFGQSGLTFNTITVWDMQGSTCVQIK